MLILITKHLKYKHKGFTLLEIVIALFIFSIISLLTATGINLLIKTQERLLDKSQQLNELQIALTMLQTDLWQKFSKPSVLGVPPDFTVETSFLGFNMLNALDSTNPNQIRGVRKVVYLFDNNQLSRVIWRAANDPQSEIDNEVLIHHVTHLTFKIVKSKLNSKNTVGLILDMELPNLGHIQRVFITHKQTKS